MDKQALLSAIPCSSEERLTLASLLDKWEASQRKNIPTSTRFLTEQEQALASQLMNRAGGDLLLYGGYEGAERKVALFLPDYLQEEDVDFPLCELALLRCEADKYHELPLTHRDYLGALMAMGIERDTVGDLLIDGRMADLIVTESAASLIVESLTSVGRCRVTCSVAAPESIHIPRIEYETFTDTVASLRLDCLIASGFRLSREEAAKAIRGGRVQVNGREAGKPDSEVKAGDKLALRGGGKVILSEVGGLSKKGRLRIQFQKPK